MGRARGQDWGCPGTPAHWGRLIGGTSEGREGRRQEGRKMGDGRMDVSEPPLLSLSNEDNSRASPQSCDEDEVRKTRDGDLVKRDTNHNNHGECLSMARHVPGTLPRASFTFISS